MMRVKFLRVLSLGLSLFLFFAFAACSPSENGDNGNNNGGDNDKITALSSVLEPNEQIKALFDLNNKVEIIIEIAESELEQINDDYIRYSSMDSKSPIYRKCDLEIKIGDVTVQMDEVGIRMKGNTSRRSFYDAENGIYDMIHYKLSFCETFDDEEYYSNPKQFGSSAQRDERKNRTLYGMEKLDLKWNKNFDDSHVKELHAYNFFREHNVLAPRCNKAKVMLSTDKGEYNMGIFNMLEAVDKTFIDRYLKKEDRGGDLYKCGWGSGGGASLTSYSAVGIGIEDEDIAYFPTYDLKTNKKTSDHSLMKGLINELNSKSVQALDARFNEIVDENYFFVFEAISYLVGNPDDLRNNYNNYYIYFLKSNSKAIFIPYDYDRVFGINMDWNPTGDGMVSIEPFTRQRGAGGNQENPLYTKTFIKNGNLRMMEAFGTILTELIKSDYLDVAVFNEGYEIARQHYKDDAMPSKSEISWAGVEFKNAQCNKLDSTSLNIDFATYIELKCISANQGLPL